MRSDIALSVVCSDWAQNATPARRPVPAPSRTDHRRRTAGASPPSDRWRVRLIAACGRLRATTTEQEHGPMAVDISGTCMDKLGAVKDAFAANFLNNGDVGATVAVVMNNELVVDLWGGSQDAKRTIPWQRDTIINVFSTTKTMSCLSLLVLASRGLVDVDAPVEKYWPEFGQNGKGNVLVRHLLSHTAGLPAWDQRIEPTDIYDWHKVTGLLAQQATWWEPGWKSGYHALSQG